MTLPSVWTYVRPETVSVTILGRPFVLHGSTAMDWIGALGYDLHHLSGIMPGLLHDEQLETMHELATSHNDIDSRWLHAATTALGKASGRDWTWTYNLTVQCLQGWQYVNGLLLHKGVSARTLPYPDWLDAAYMLLWHQADESDRKALDFQLGLPPKDVPVVAQASTTRKMLEAFAAD